jgi:hypothetical protein
MGTALLGLGRLVEPNGIQYGCQALLCWISFRAEHSIDRFAGYAGLFRDVGHLSGLGHIAKRFRKASRESSSAASQVTRGFNRIDQTLHKPRL